MKVKIQATDEQGNFYQGELELNKKKQKILKKDFKNVNKLKTVKPSEAIYQLYQKNFFQIHKSLTDVERDLGKLGYHYKKGSVLMALKRSKYLIKSGKRWNYKFAQKYPSKE